MINRSLIRPGRKVPWPEPACHGLGWSFHGQRTGTLKVFGRGCQIRRGHSQSPAVSFGCGWRPSFLEDVIGRNVVPWLSAGVTLGRWLKLRFYELKVPRNRSILRRIAFKFQEVRLTKLKQKLTKLQLEAPCIQWYPAKSHGNHVQYLSSGEHNQTPKEQRGAFLLRNVNWINIVFQS